MDDVFAKSATRVVKARDSRLRSRLVSIVLIDRRHCYSTRRALIVSPAAPSRSFAPGRKMRLSGGG